MPNRHQNRTIAIERAKETTCTTSPADKDKTKPNETEQQISIANISSEPNGIVNKFAKFHPLLFVVCVCVFLFVYSKFTAHLRM